MELKKSGKVREWSKRNVGQPPLLRRPRKPLAGFGTLPEIRGGSCPREDLIRAYSGHGPELRSEFPRHVCRLIQRRVAIRSADPGDLNLRRMKGQDDCIPIVD